MAPYLRMETPATSCRLNEGTRATTPELFLAWQSEMLLDKGDLARPWSCDLPVDARIEHGRWFATCINCGGSVRTHPEWRLACCAECGCVMRKVIIPENYEELERLLLARPRRENQSWLPGEQAADLQRQNEEHGVAS